MQRYWNSPTFASRAFAFLLHSSICLALLATPSPAFAGPDDNATEKADEDKPASEEKQKADETPQKPARVHELRDVEGWSVRVDRQLLEGEHEELGATALKVLAQQLYLISLMLPEDRVEKLREVPIFLDLDHPLGNLQYHPDAGWLKNHGHDTAMEKAVHIPTAQRLINLVREQSQPAVMLHELAHAYHDRVLDFDHPPIRALYDEAVKSGKYESVLQGRGKNAKHYALTNHKEFFAEMTESFLCTNDFYPFVRAELLQFDPAVAKLLQQIWLKTD